MNEPEEVLDEAFRSLALIIGGMFAMGKLPDDAVWSLMRSMDVVRMRALRALAVAPIVTEAETKPNLQPHPAIEYLLSRLKEL